MKIDFFNTLETILQSTNFTNLQERFAHFYDDVKRSCIIFESDSLPLAPKLLQSTTMMNDKNISALKIRRPNHAKSKEAIAKILHSVAHIESSAIILALDACYRFRNMPKEFYMDWLSVADEEIKHFGLLEELLTEVNSYYGAFYVHNTLFDAMQMTSENLLERMGVVHRGLEAKGLDANPFVLEKLMQTTLVIKPKIREVFDVILCDEIGHVQKGDKWWKYAQKYLPQPQSFMALCEDFSDFSLAGKILNLEARLQAGFSIDELEKLQAFYAKRTNTI